jgi:hypothetical protein
LSLVFKPEATMATAEAHLKLVLSTPSKPYSFDREIALGALKFWAKERKTAAYVALKKGWQDPVTILKFSYLMRQVPQDYDLQQTIDFAKSLRAGYRADAERLAEYTANRGVALRSADRAFDLVLVLRWVRRFRPGYFATISANGRLTRHELPSNLSTVLLAQDGSGVVIEKREPSPAVLAAE